MRLSPAFGEGGAHCSGHNDSATRLSACCNAAILGAQQNSKNQSQPHPWECLKQAMDMWVGHLPLPPSPLCLLPGSQRKRNEKCRRGKWPDLQRFRAPLSPPLPHLRDCFICSTASPSLFYHLAFTIIATDTPRGIGSWGHPPSLPRILATSSLPGPRGGHFPNSVPDSRIMSFSE